MYTRVCAQRLVGRDDRPDKANEIIMETIFQNYIATTVVVVTLGAGETGEERTFRRADTARPDTTLTSRNTSIVPEIIDERPILCRLGAIEPVSLFSTDGRVRFPSGRVLLM